MKKILGIYRLMRVPNDIAIGVAVIIGEVISVAGVPNSFFLILGFLSGFFISASIMVLNDIFDIEIDRINNPDRPIVSGIVALNEAYILSGMCATVGVYLAYLLSIYNFIIGLLFWFLGVLYNWRLKKTGFLGNIIVSLSVAIPYIYGGFATGNPAHLLLYIFAIMSFLANLGREIIKGISDIEGDRTKKIETVAIKYGLKYAAFVASVFIIISVIISVIPVIYDLVGVLYVPPVLITDVLFMYSTIVIIRNPSKTHSIIVKKYIFIGMIFGLLAFLLGITIK
jgi:geranylgeranylglycerol-phosphate geranylgeranyltransferase